MKNCGTTLERGRNQTWGRRTLLYFFFFSGAGSGLIGSVVGGSVGHMLSDKAARKAAKKAAKHGGQHPGQYPQGQHGGGETTGLFLKSWNLSLFQSAKLLTNF